MAGTSYRCPSRKIGAKRTPQPEEPETQQQGEEWKERKERTCAALQLYKGKTSAQPEKEGRSTYTRPELPKTGKNVQMQASYGMEGEGNQRLSAEASASKGVFRIAPGPRGSGIQDVSKFQKGPEKKSHGAKGSMTKAEFEQQILERTG